ncbi:hypothetical protein NAI58_10780, partial [Francisella tularensis subsp. holarctica]|nr:hypothetical protein [Francisella tularensis subsp. holarctica]
MIPYANAKLDVAKIPAGDYIIQPTIHDIPALAAHFLIFCASRIPPRLTRLILIILHAWSC